MMAAKKHTVVPNSGMKFDEGKPPLALISRTALEEEARVMAYGVEKYGLHQWRAGMDFSRLMDATLRHVYAFADGEDLDKETGLSHLAHARCCLAFLLEYQGKSLGKDDRYGR
jgi:hypothetical protein